MENGIFRQILKELRSYFNPSSFVGFSIVICSFWGLAQAQLGYTPAQWFHAILEAYATTIGWASEPVNRALVGLGFEVELTELWLYITALGMYYASADAMLMGSSGRGTVGALFLYTGSLLLMLVAGVLIDVAVADIDGGVQKELLIFWLWVGAIVVVEVYDQFLTLIIKPWREEWARSYNVSPDEPVKLIYASTSRLFLHQILWPGLVATPIVYFTYEAGVPSEGFLAITVYLLWLMVYWPWWGIIGRYKSRRHIGFTERLAEDYHWRFGIALFAAAITVVLVGIIGLAGQMAVS